MHPLVKRVYETIRRENLIEPQDTVFVALSGGADSVALLHLLHHLQSQLSVSLVALHVHHGLRGETADRDERFVRELCDSLGVPLKIAHVDVKTEADLQKESLEQAGRRLRYAFFEREASAYVNAKIATAHSASDRAETVLLHLIRGSGMRGVTGIPVRRGNIIRPLLECTAQDIRCFCDECGYPYMTDETNEDVYYSRNRIRHNVLPEMKKINAQAENSINRFAHIASEEDAFLSTLADSLLSCSKVTDNIYKVAPFMDADPVLRRRAIMKLMEYAEFSHAEALCTVMQQGGCVNFPGDVSVISDGEILTIVKHNRFERTDVTNNAASISEDGLFTFGGYDYRITCLSYKEYCFKRRDIPDVDRFCFVWDQPLSLLSVRSRKAGDDIRPVGRGCTKSVKKLLNEEKVTVDERDRIPVLTFEDKVLIVLGVCVDESAAISESTDAVAWVQCLGTTKK